MFPPGREALVRDPAVAEALQQVVVEGWTDEARLSAESALLAMSDRQPEAGGHEHHSSLSHVMLSCKYTRKPLVISNCPDRSAVAADQWSHQQVVKRIVSELQVRGYRTWFGALHHPPPSRCVPSALRCIG